MKNRLALIGSLLSFACAPLEPAGHGDASAQTSSSSGGGTTVDAAASTTAPASTSSMVERGSTTADDVYAASSTGVQTRCDDLGEQEKGLLRTVYVMGHSNTPGSCDACTFEAFASTSAGYYYGFALTRLWERLEPCIDYEASFFVQRSPGDAQTLFLSVGRAWGLAHGSDLDEFRERIVDLLDAVEGSAFLGDIPEPGLSSDAPDAAAKNVVLAEIFAEHPRHELVSADALFDALRAGTASYDGAVLDVETVLPDGLHLSPLGHQIVGDLFIAHLNAKFPALDLQPYGELVFE